MTDGAAWEQMPGESAKAYAAFRVFRDLGPTRSIAQAFRASKGEAGAIQGQKGGTPRPPSHWEGWSSTFRWLARARAWDTEQRKREEEVKAAEFQADLEKSRERARKLAKKNYKAAALLLDGAIDALKNPTSDGIAPGTAAYMIQVGALVGKGGFDMDVEALGVRALQKDMMEREKALPNDSGFEEEDARRLGEIASEEAGDYPGAA